MSQIYNAPRLWLRARYGTGVLLKLNKRECNIRIRLTPCGADFEKVQMEIGDERQDFFLSSIMGNRFSSFLWAVYCLYEEEERDYEHWKYFKHSEGFKREFRKDGSFLTIVKLCWNGESYGHATVHLSREGKEALPIPDEKDVITLRFDRRRKSYTYEVDRRDLCYALAKAYTEALKKYGFRGYEISSSGYDPGASLSHIDELLFIKAYALNAMGVQKPRLMWQNPNGWTEAHASSFEKEIELLLFDM